MTTAREIMTDAAKKIAARPDEARQVGALYKFVLKGDDGGTWMVDLTESPSVQEKDGSAPCTLTLSTSDFVALMQGNEPPQALFFAGKLQIEGDVMAALRLQSLRELLA
jgi:(3R)-3-hydroxyacyl-CoA dehydrogenase / 3a,7a,12a-trihydroxy-5b-cholest-24-enoyl-CoA hydratase / enoyl-CoA hydratase 2